MTPPAASSPHGNWKSPIMSCRPTGQVRVSAPVVSIRANRNSFQALMAMSTVVARRPLRATGSAIRHIAPSLEQPSMRAASSSSPGRSSKKPFMSQMNIGSRKLA
jgi:hypothetical protein